MNKVIKFFLGILLLAIYSALSTIFLIVNNEQLSIILGIVSLVIILVIIIINIVLLITLKKKVPNVNEVITKFQKSKDESQDSKKYRNKIIRIISYVYLYTIVLLISLICLSNSFVYFTKMDAIYVLILICSIEAIITLSILCGTPKDKITIRLLASEYPFLHSILSKVKTSLNFKNKITFVPTDGSNVSVYNNKGELIILLGVFSLEMLTEDELEAVIYHEIAHIINDDVKDSYRLNNKVSSFKNLVEQNETFSFLTYFFYGAITTYLMFYYELYKHNSQLERELLADDTILPYVNKQAFINALAKMHMIDTYSSLPSIKSIYKDNVECPKDFIYYVNNKMRNEVKENLEMYRSFIFNELQITFATHPTLIQRMNKFAITDFDYFTKSENETYLKEIDMIISGYNKDWYEYYKNSYKSERKFNYLKFEEEIASAKDVNEMSSNEIASLALAYENISEISKAIELYKLSIEKNSNNSFALFSLGRNYICKNNIEGIELIKKSITLNNNYFESGMEIIANYYNRNNMLEEKENFRKLMLVELQQNIDKQRKEELTKKSDIIVDTLSDEDIRIIVDEASKYSVIKELRIVGHNVDNQYIRHYVGIMFKSNCDEVEMKKAYEEIFYLLDNFKNDSNYDFNLSVYDYRSNDIFSNVIKGKYSKIIYKNYEE